MDNGQKAWRTIGKLQVSKASGKKYSYSGHLTIEGQSYFIQLYDSKTGGLSGPIKLFPPHAKNTKSRSRSPSETRHPIRSVFSLTTENAETSNRSSK